MDLNEAVRRIFLVHRKLILLCAVLGVIGGLAVTADRPATVHRRDAIDPRGLRRRNPRGRRGGGGRGRGARDEQGDRRGSRARSWVSIAIPLKVAKDSISVKTLGSSDLVQLEVTDTRPEVASALANALARSSWTGGQT